MNKIYRKLLMLVTHKTAEELYIEDLKKCGIAIGSNLKIWDPDSVLIDIQRPHMLHIGDYVKITSGVTILSHDYSRSVAIMYAGENYGEARMTWIGDNVFIGMKSIILMGTHIGNNSIVGAGSVVSGSFPDGVVIAGNPAKVVCTIDEYIKKRKEKTLSEAVQYADCWKKKYGVYPTITEMTNAFAWLYLPRNEETVEKYNYLFDLNGIDIEAFKKDFMKTLPKFKSFKDFLEYVEVVTEEKND